MPRVLTPRMSQKIPNGAALSPTAPAMPCRPPSVV
nr:MAG TPA: hypothetical protein [Caudoviricetes sp.]